MVKAFKADNSAAQSNSIPVMIEIILDETGSMGSVAKPTIDGFNEYINGQKLQPGNCFVTLTKFEGGNVKVVYQDLEVKQVPDLNNLTYQPAGATNLYDTIGTRIANLTARTTAAGPCSKLVVIMTDGMDNMSREYTPAILKEIITAKEGEGWTFVYMGANQDAWAVGSTFGIQAGNSHSYDINNVGGMMSTLSAATSSYRSFAASSTDNVRDFFGGSQ